MTENKRFKNVEENLEWGTVQYFTYYDEKITDKELEKLVNHLLNQNDELNDENQKLDEKICSLTMDLIKTKSYEQLEKELNRIKNENEQLKQDLGEYCDFSLHDVLDKKNKKIERLQSTLAYRSNQLALMEQLINDLGHEEMKRQMEEILND